MSAAGGLRQEEIARQSIPRRIIINSAASIDALLFRRRASPSVSWWPTSGLGFGALATIAAASLSMLLLDSWVMRHHGSLPRWLVIAAGEVTDFGKSGWFLIPTSILLVAIAAVASPALGRTTYLVLASLAARLGFIFVAVGLPSLFTTIAKRLIGRARPLRMDGTDIYFAPFAWRVDFASLPSGHATTAFAGAVALGALFPRARLVLWIYAVTIALSRVILRTHYPSDVIAGALVGAVGALLVRQWFATRRLAFAPRADGTVKRLPGPSWQRIKKVARTLSGQ